MPIKPKRPQSMTPDGTQLRDQFQTPDYATDLIVPFVPFQPVIDTIVWECCAGPDEKMARRLRHWGCNVLATDISDGWNILECNVLDWHCAITNPPYSLKERIVERFIKLDKPFAFLIPGDWAQWLINAVTQYNCRLIVPSRRINYITPNGRRGRESSAQFHSVWLTRYFHVPERVVFVELTKEQMENI